METGMGRARGTAAACFRRARAGHARENPIQPQLIATRERVANPIVHIQGDPWLNSVRRLPNISTSYV